MHPPSDEQGRQPQAQDGSGPGPEALAHARRVRRLIILLAAVLFVIPLLLAWQRLS
jgi:hypothetical protein